MHGGVPIFYGSFGHLTYAHAIFPIRPVKYFSNDAHFLLCGLVQRTAIGDRLDRVIVVIKSGLDFEFDVTNVSNSVYQIAKESDEIPIQYARSRTVGGSLKFHF
jgi:hypothetical protein